MDLQLILRGLEDFLFFNTEDQSVEIRNLPPGHPLERFQDGNKLDVKKYFEHVDKYFMSVCPLYLLPVHHVL